MTASLKVILPFILLFTKSTAEGLIHFTYMNHADQSGIRVLFQPEGDTNSSIPMIYLNFRQLNTTCQHVTGSALTYWQVMSWKRERKYYYLNNDSPTLMPGYCIAYRIAQCVRAGEPCRAVGNSTQFYDVPLNINSSTATRTVSTTMRSTMITKAATSGSRSKSLKKKLDYSTPAILISLLVVGLAVLFIGITCTVALKKWMKQGRARQREIRALAAEPALCRGTRQTACRIFVPGRPENDSTPPSYSSLSPRLERPRHTQTVDSSHCNENTNVSQLDAAPSAPPLELLDLQDLEPMSYISARNNICNENNNTRNFYSQQQRLTTQPQNLPPSYNSEMLISYLAQRLPNYPPPQYGRF
ncbi:uncharacterized protein [Watersipora subatra]|uniref:uncharacterized protein n=1 Tax=Watersipora subatra TaxID=2589382 RepID=UPI00355C8DE4